MPRATCATQSWRWRRPLGSLCPVGNWGPWGGGAGACPELWPQCSSLPIQKKMWPLPRTPTLSLGWGPGSGSPRGRQLFLGSWSFKRSCACVPRGLRVRGYRTQHLYPTPSFWAQDKAGHFGSPPSPPRTHRSYRVRCSEAPASLSSPQAEGALDCMQGRETGTPESCGPPPPSPGVFGITEVRSQGLLPWHPLSICSSWAPGGAVSAVLGAGVPSAAWHPAGTPGRPPLPGQGQRVAFRNSCSKSKGVLSWASVQALDASEAGTERGSQNVPLNHLCTTAHPPPQPLILGPSTEAQP